MLGNEIDLLSIHHGAVTSPAGCGKTHLIAIALTRHVRSKPILVLTHTNAGVAALRSRLDHLHVPRTAYRLSTIDGWAMRLTRAFPARSGIAPAILQLSAPQRDYPLIRTAATKLLGAGHIDDILAASYYSLMVDEYQDCSIAQHALIRSASKTLRTCILDDPMQAIFGFAGNQLVPWSEAIAEFPVVAELTIPWRWINAGAGPLGDWLLDVRRRLVRGEPVDLRTAPAAVRWVEMDGKYDHPKRLAAARISPRAPAGKALVIGDSRNPTSRSTFARQIPGAVTVEAVDLRDLVAFATSLDLGKPTAALKEVVGFAQDMMTNVGASEFLARVASLHRGTARRPPATAEAAALTFVREPTYGRTAELLVEIGKQAGVRAHRPTILRAALKALQQCPTGGRAEFQAAATRMREEGRLIGRPLARRTVGSTLLLKGLEADIVVILDADALDAPNLYVAMTRGSTQLTICSRTPILMSNAQAPS